MAYGAIIGQTPTVQASAEMTSYNNDNTSSVITADNVQGAIDQLFTSVSNGKSQIASAITDMGVSTSANDSFAQMATNIGNIETGYDTSQVTATANTVRSGYKFVNSSGQLIAGTIPSKGAQTYTPKTVSQTISSGQYLSGNQTIQGDGNLVASNIKSGVSIFGVSGNYVGKYNISEESYSYTCVANNEYHKIDLVINTSKFKSKKILFIFSTLQFNGGATQTHGIGINFFVNKSTSECFVVGQGQRYGIIYSSTPAYADVFVGSDIAITLDSIYDDFISDNIEVINSMSTDNEKFYIIYED